MIKNFQINMQNYNLGENSRVNFWDYLSGLMEIGFLSTAIKLNIFEILSDKKFKKIKAIQEELRLDCTTRTLADFLDKLTVHNYLEREEILENSSYKITEKSYKYFTLASKDSIVNLMQRISGYIERIPKLHGIIKNGKIPDEHDFFTTTYESIEAKNEFIKSCMTHQIKNFEKIAKSFPFKNYGTFLDIGGGPAAFSMCIKKLYQEIECFSFDLEDIEQNAYTFLKENQMEDKITLLSGDLFKYKFLQVDLVAMGNILHEYNHESKQKLFKIAYEALNTNGALLIIEEFIDDKREENSDGLNMSLLMILYYGDSFNLSFRDIQEYAGEAGFSKVENMTSTIGANLIICYKN